MSAKVVRVGKVGKHPHADKLSLTHVDGKLTCFGNGEFKPGDRAVWIEGPTVVNTHLPDFSWLSKSKQFYRIRPKEIRGLVSRGILVPLTINRPVGDDVSHHYGIVAKPVRAKLSRCPARRPFWKKLLGIFGI